MENEKDNLYSVISGITELDKNIINEAKKRVDSLAKPLGRYSIKISWNYWES